MEIPVENELAFFPPSVKAGNVTLGPLTLAGLVRIGRLGVDVGRAVPREKVLDVAFVLSGETDHRRFLKLARGRLGELSTAVEKVLNEAFSTFIKPAQGKAVGPVSLTPHGIGLPLEYAEFLCAEYGWSWETATGTPLATVYALVAAHRQRTGGRHGGFDYIEKRYAAELAKARR